MVGRSLLHSGICCLLTSIILGTATLGLSGTAEAITPVFKEVSAASGIALQNETNTMSAGIAWIDFNNDGAQDLYIPNQTGPNRLFQNDGSGQFTEIGAAAGVQLSTSASQGVAIGDYDGDGYDDLFVANSGFNTLLRNLGDGTFSNVTNAAGLNDVSKRSFAASFGDVNGDGRLDLYVGHWDFQNQPTLHCPDNDLYLNNGDGTFSNVSVETGTNNPGCAFTVPMTDFDQDGDLDIFLPNDNVAWGSQTPSLDNEMLRNDGLGTSGLPVFTAVGDEVGLGESTTGMGVAIGDYDNDGDIDYYRTVIGPGPLSTNDGTNNFTPTTLNGDGGTGWGAAFFDADNDGFVDLYRGNSLSGFSGGPQANKFFYNNGDGTFTQMVNTVGLTGQEAGLGLAVADYDNDGDMDVVVHGRNGVVDLYRNDTPMTNNWLKIELQGEPGNHRGIGSIVRLGTSNGVETRQQLRETHAGSSHGSTHAAPVLFGLGDHATVVSLVVDWPDGCSQSVSVSGVNQIISVDQSDCLTISGIVTTPTGESVAGIQIQINDNFGFASTSTTDADGFYSQEVTNGTYVVYGLSHPDYDVNCGFIFVTVSGTDVTKNCTATPILPVISGTVTTPSGEPVAGVQIQINDNFGFTSTSTTDANGFYSQEVTDGTYVVYGLTHPDYDVNCGFIFVTVSGADVAKNCTGTPL